MRFCRFVMSLHALTDGFPVTEANIGNCYFLGYPWIHRHRFSCRQIFKKHIFFDQKIPVHLTKTSENWIESPRILMWFSVRSLCIHVVITSCINNYVLVTKIRFICSHLLDNKESREVYSFEKLFWLVHGKETKSFAFQPLRKCSCYSTILYFYADSDCVDWWK